jgi:hypothetical protein
VTLLLTTGLKHGKTIPVEVASFPLFTSPVMFIHSFSKCTFVLPAIQGVGDIKANKTFLLTSGSMINFNYQSF